MAYSNEAGEQTKTCLLFIPCFQNGERVESRKGKLEVKGIFFSTPVRRERTFVELCILHRVLFVSRKSITNDGKQVKFS